MWKMWKRFRVWLKVLWEDVRVFMATDMRVFDDFGTISGAPLHPNTIRMIKEARRRVGISRKK